MRITKEAEERRNEILDAADRLFEEKGFDGTSTNDILDRVGIARGTLYYHFKSKEDIMDALIERYNRLILDAARYIADKKEIPVCERIVQVVMAMNMSNFKSGREITSHINKPQNALMHQKVERMILRNVTPIITQVVMEGVEQGIFHTPFPYESVEMILAYANGVFDGLAEELGGEELFGRVQAFIFNVERLLGAEAGSLSCMMRLFAGGESKMEENNA